MKIFSAFPEARGGSVCAVAMGTVLLLHEVKLLAFHVARLQREKFSEYRKSLPVVGLVHADTVERDCDGCCSSMS